MKSVMVSMPRGQDKSPQHRSRLLPPNQQKMPTGVFQKKLLLTHKTLLLTVPQRGGSNTISHQGKESFLYL